MMKTRTLLQHSITKLEEMFIAGKSDLSLLQNLDNELNYRDTARAQKLLGEVQKELARAGRQVISRKPVSPPAPAPSPIIAPKQPELWEVPKKESAVAPATVPNVAPAAGVTAPESGLPARDTLYISPRVPATLRQSVAQVEKTKTAPPSVSAADAYKILQVSPASSWEAIEAARRRVVQKAFPELWAREQAGERDQAQNEAMLANEACRVLWQMRIPSTRAE